MLPIEARRVAYVHSDTLVEAADRLPANLGRASMVHDLVASLPGLSECLSFIEPVRATRSDLLRFHAESLVGALRALRIKRAHPAQMSCSPTMTATRSGHGSAHG
jgi:acetoin utilization deacetylase AcuC-like enzyme